MSAGNGGAGAGAGGEAGMGGAHAGHDGVDPAAGDSGSAGDAESAGAGGASEQSVPIAPDPIEPWHGSLGAWCSDEDETVHELVLSSNAYACTASAPGGMVGGDIIRAELPKSLTEGTETLTDLPARFCGAKGCVDAALSLDFEAGAGISADEPRGRFRALLPTGDTQEGPFLARRCTWNVTPDVLSLPSGVRGLSLREAALFQGVKVPLMERMHEVKRVRAEVVATRAGLLRVSVDATSDWQPRTVQARLLLSNGDEPELVLEQELRVMGSSTDAELTSTFNFDIDAEALREGTRYALELRETSGCAATGERSPGRFPETGAAELRARGVGSVVVEIVPLRIRQSNGPELLPDTSPEQIEQMRRTLVGLFPIAGAEVRVRPEPVDSNARSALEAVDEITALRDAEAPDRRVTYYGLFRFTDTLEQYCGARCVLGAGVVGEAGDFRGGSAVGVGYSGGVAASTFAHELGHVYGRDHTPCNVTGDPDYPYHGGRIGSWGYDTSTRTLIPPTHADFMSYCSPTWVSDYVFGQLAGFIGSVNVPMALARFGQPRRYRTVLLEAGRPPRFGLPRTLSVKPVGRAEPAEVQHANDSWSTLSVYRSRLSDVAAEMVYVPDPEDRTWSRIRLRGAPPLDYPDVAATAPQP